ncbi:MAG: 4-alpha-glucanotransferase [Acidobacteria bacterium]|nr:4-alpha-glucanotransferase [Acidobacteriota bacterium]
MLTSAGTRRAGLLVPLFSMPSSRSWGIGEIGDIPTMAAWMSSAGQRVLQLLPINEMPLHETSPYSALSAMAIDPQFISIADLEDFVALGGEPALEPDLRIHLEHARAAKTVDYALVRTLKETVLRRSFARFVADELETQTVRAEAFRAYVDAESWWLDDYALFRALHAKYDEGPWSEWPEPLRRREPAAIAEARLALTRDILYRQYLQWVAGTQWAAARSAVGDVAIWGDLPFMVSSDSADVWARQDDFCFDVSVGVPPDAFSETGQDWNLPAYRWDVVRSGGYAWLRARARRNAALFDGYRVDHLVGFYRTYVRPLDGSGARFTPAEQADQIALGEQVLAVFREPGAEIIAEDLGVVPPFVRESLERQAIPGYKVFRWERAWHHEGQPFLDPAGYSPLSVATSGTHDTEPLAVWWATAPPEERHALRAIPSLCDRLSSQECLSAFEGDTLSAPLRDLLLETLYGSSSMLLILPIQDVFGWRDRINQPATVNSSNWTWRLPWPVDRFNEEREALAVAGKLKKWAKNSRRSL